VKFGEVHSKGRFGSVAVAIFSPNAGPPEVLAAGAAIDDRFRPPPTMKENRIVRGHVSNGRLHWRRCGPPSDGPGLGSRHTQVWPTDGVTLDPSAIESNVLRPISNPLATHIVSFFETAAVSLRTSSSGCMSLVIRPSDAGSGWRRRIISSAPHELENLLRKRSRETTLTIFLGSCSTGDSLVDAAA